MYFKIPARVYLSDVIAVCTKSHYVYTHVRKDIKYTHTHTHTHHIAGAKWRQGDNCETAWKLAGTSETSWKNTTTSSHNSTHTNNSRAPHRSQRLHGDTDCCRLPFCASKHVASSRGCVGRWTWEQLSLSHTHRNKHTHTHTLRGSQEAAITLLAGMSASSGQFNTCTHTHRRLAVTLHTWVCLHAGERDEMIREIWKCQPCHRRRGTRELKTEGEEESWRERNRLLSIPLRRREDCGAALKGIVPSQEVWSDRATGGGGQRERERERQRERQREGKEEKKGKGEGGRCRYMLYMREREKQHVVKRESGKPIRGGDMREQWSED